jgi:hypothetical protein
MGPRSSGFFFVAALGLVFLAGVALIQPWGSGDTAPSVVRGEGVFFLVVAFASVLGGF